MHLEGLNGFDYFPGETVICPKEALMRIDFPDAQPDMPTQCTALVIEDAYLQEQIDFLNMTATSNSFGGPLKIDSSDAHFRNSENLVRITEKLLKITRSDHPRKDTFADLALKEMVLSIVQEQQLRALLVPENAKNSGPFTALLQFVHGNLANDITVAQLCKVTGMSKSQLYREFNDTFGIAPKQFILNERIKHARLLLQQEDLSVKEACYACGFSDPNYFVRAFKKVMGVTPGRMQRAD
jgi:AraC-like DNA-binding protein